MTALPTWTADAASKLCDIDNLLLIEGKYQGRPAIFIARLSVVQEAQRIECQVLAMLNTTDMLKDIEIDDENAGVYSLTEVAQTDSIPG